jgi:hypothetical protein
MRRLILRAVVLVAVVLSTAMPAFAQLEQGRLTGTVADAQGALLPGVTVTATSPSLIGNQVAVTEQDGKFLFPALPSGTYTLTFTLSGFKRVKRDNIVLTLGARSTSICSWRSPRSRKRDGDGRVAAHRHDDDGGWKRVQGALSNYGC